MHQDREPGLQIPSLARRTHPVSPSHTCAFSLGLQIAISRSQSLLMQPGSHNEIWSYGALRREPQRIPELASNTLREAKNGG